MGMTQAGFGGFLFAPERHDACKVEDIFHITLLVLRRWVELWRSLYVMEANF